MSNNEPRMLTSSASATSALASIPTISASISSSAETVCTTEATPSTLHIVQQKFKDNEKVLLIFEAYQIVGQEHTSRLLALVVSVVGGTYAIFALTAARLPPRNCGDLSIEKIFPLNDSFSISTDKKGSVSQLQFELKNADEAAVKYFYYPIISAVGSSEFCAFYAQVIAVKKSMSLSGAGVDSQVLSFSWLNDYRQIGEVKQELKRREHEYIVYKDFSVYCATWNVNNKSYCDSPLHLWLGACATPPDIYAIALQELDTSAKAITFNENRPDALWM